MNLSLNISYTALAYPAISAISGVAAPAAAAIYIITNETIRHISKNSLLPSPFITVLAVAGGCFVAKQLGYKMSVDQAVSLAVLHWLIGSP